jgi:hypothetical protein
MSVRFANQLRLVPILMWTALLAGVFAVSGCLGSVVGVVAAPQAVVAGAAAEMTTAGGQALASTGLSDPDPYADTLQDLDRIIANNPDASNQAELIQLKQDLVDKRAAEAASQKAAKIPKTSDFERRDEGARSLSRRMARRADETNEDKATNEFDRTKAVKEDPWANQTMITSEPRQERHLRRDPPPLIGAESDKRRDIPKPFITPRCSSLEDWHQYYYEYTSYQRW